MSEKKPAEIAEVLIEAEIEATPETVWSELTNNIGAWWPAEFYGGGEEGKRDFHLDPTPGGRMYESWRGGGGLLWGQVILVDPGRKLQILGVTFPDWGGPSSWFGTWELAEHESGCKLRFSESTLGKIEDGNAAEKEKGWNYLFGGVLKAHVEGRPKPQWIS